MSDDPVDRARQIKPQISARGELGIPIGHELEKVL